MWLIAAALLAIATVPVAGGSLGRLSSLRPRSPWLLWGAVGLQVGAFASASAFAPLPRGLHIASYVAAGAFLWRNRKLPWSGLVAAGGGLNFLAICVNGGVMPASAAALRRAGLSPASHFTNSAPISGAHLAFLGDVFALPARVPLANVFSVGDLLITAGLVLMVHRQAGSVLWGRGRSHRCCPVCGAPDPE